MEEHPDTKKLHSPGQRASFETSPPSSNVIYHALPVTFERYPGAPFWRIELHDGTLNVMGLDVYADVVLGRTETADIDLDPLGAQEYGVSRRHAVLRPAAGRLFLVDQGSTNGTIHNDTLLQPGIARQIQNNDIMILGHLPLMVKVVLLPAEDEAS